MVLHGQGLAFGLEAGRNLGGVHARLDHLDGDVPSNGLDLLREPDFSHPARAEPVEKAVYAERHAGNPAASATVSR